MRDVTSTRVALDYPKVADTPLKSEIKSRVASLELAYEKRVPLTKAINTRMKKLLADAANQREITSFDKHCCEKIATPIRKDIADKAAEMKLARDGRQQDGTLPTPLKKDIVMYKSEDHTHTSSINGKKFDVTIKKEYLDKASTLKSACNMSIQKIVSTPLRKEIVSREVEFNNRNKFPTPLKKDIEEKVRVFDINVFQKLVSIKANIFLLSRHFELIHR